MFKIHIPKINPEDLILKLFLFSFFIFVLSLILKFLFFKNLNVFEIFFGIFDLLIFFIMGNIFLNEINKFLEVYFAENSKDLLKQIIIIVMTFFLVLIPQIYLFLFLFEII